MSEKKLTSFVCTLTPDEITRLEAYLHEHGWDFSTVPHAHWKASSLKINVVAYLSGKLTVQGANTSDFIEFVLEPEIVKQVGIAIPEPEIPLDLTLHGGIDESGKGDFFGPLVIAGVCTGPASAPRLAAAGVCDSKLIKSSAKIREIAAKIRIAVEGRFTVVTLLPETYNRLYAKIGNLNRLLAWGHARSIENLLERAPECPRMLSDKFADERLIQRALMEKGRQIQLDQRTKAESDIAVAAASILAREQFLRGMDQLSKECGVQLVRGAGPAVKEAARAILRAGGPEKLASVAKTHFKTFDELLAE